MSALEPQDIKLITDIAKYGCHVVHVFDEKGLEPSFAYSVGFGETVGQPEVIIFGLPKNIMQYMVNEILEQCRTGLVLEESITIYGLLEGHKCISRAVHPTQLDRHLGHALWYARHREANEAIQAVQIFWPGTKNRLFPWENDCAIDVIEAQPRLDIERPVA